MITTGPTFGYALAKPLPVRNCASVAGLFVHLMPVFGIVLAWLVLGERLLPFHVAGIVLILSGIWLTSRHGRRGSRGKESRRAGLGSRDPTPA